LTEFEKTIYDILTKESLYMDELVKLTKANIQKAAIAITNLQLKGFIGSSNDGKLRIAT
jgi:hypothetical protein